MELSGIVLVWEYEVLFASLEVVAAVPTTAT